MLEAELHVGRGKKYKCSGRVLGLAFLSDSCHVRALEDLATDLWWTPAMLVMVDPGFGFINTLGESRGDLRLVTE